jgi:hypothetical protein
MDKIFDVDSPRSVRRLQAAIQFINRDFAQTMRQKEPKYFISQKDAGGRSSVHLAQPDSPEILSHEQALGWIARVLVRSRGKKLI